MMTSTTTTMTRMIPIDDSLEEDDWILRSVAVKAAVAAPAAAPAAAAPAKAADVVRLVTP
jgi:hypothetical protein